MNDGKINRPVALVTGAFRGIGLACAKRLAAGGFDVVLNDRPTDENKNKSKGLVTEFAGIPASALTFLSDIGDLAGQADLIAAALHRFGRIDCLVNNAGVPARQRGDLLEVTPESFDTCMQINSRAVFFLTQAVVKSMLGSSQPAFGHRSIVNITSSNAVAVSILRAEYCASKAAASMITRLFAVRLADTGIGVYEIRPGIIETDMTLPVKARYDAFINESLPTKRWGFPADVAETVATLAEGRLPYTVGQAIVVDGGLTIPRF